MSAETKTAPLPEPKSLADENFLVGRAHISHEHVAEVVRDQVEYWGEKIGEPLSRRMQAIIECRVRDAVQRAVLQDHLARKRHPELYEDRLPDDLTVAHLSTDGRAAA